MNLSLPCILLFDVVLEIFIEVLWNLVSVREVSLFGNEDPISRVIILTNNEEPLADPGGQDPRSSNFEAPDHNLKAQP